MRHLPPGWATDLAVLEQSGSSVEDRGDHLLVRSPRNPDFHWGNCLFVTDKDAVHDAARWVTTFRLAFPEADWIAIGLMRMPDAPAPWIIEGVELELDEVLTTTTLPLEAPLAEGYSVRRLTGEDWDQSVERSLAENVISQTYEATSYERFAQARAKTQRALSDRNVGRRFGAFAGNLLVAELGIVRCGTTARYQSVGTDEAHRRRGLAAHLLGVAARWAADEGCDRWVIVTEATNPAGRIYRRAGFEPDTSNVTAYRAPPL